MDITVIYTNEAGHKAFKTFKDDEKNAWIFTDNIGVENIQGVKSYDAYTEDDDIIIEEMTQWFIKGDMCHYSHTINKVYCAIATTKVKYLSKEKKCCMWNEKRVFNWREGGF